MPFILIILGLILFVTAIKGTTGKLGTLLGEDVFTSGGYLYWLVSILIIGAVGYIKPLKGLSDAFIVLLLLVLVLSTGKRGASGGGLFTQFTAALKDISSQAAGTPNAATLQGLQHQAAGTMIAGSPA